MVDCAAIAESLFEAEVFGVEKGAYTGAEESRAGLFVEASGGTLFLDELGELPLRHQGSLLRALQEKKIRPVGGDDTGIAGAQAHGHHQGGKEFLHGFPPFILHEGGPIAPRGINNRRRPHSYWQGRVPGHCRSRALGR